MKRFMTQSQSNKAQSTNTMNSCHASYLNEYICILETNGMLCKQLKKYPPILTQGRLYDSIWNDFIPQTLQRRCVQSHNTRCAYRSKTMANVRGYMASQKNTSNSVLKLKAWLVWKGSHLEYFTLWAPQFCLHHSRLLVVIGRSCHLGPRSVIAANSPFHCPFVTHWPNPFPATHHNCPARQQSPGTSSFPRCFPESVP